MDDVINDEFSNFIGICCRWTEKSAVCVPNSKAYTGENIIYFESNQMINEII